MHSNFQFSFFLTITLGLTGQLFEGQVKDSIRLSDSVITSKKVYGAVADRFPMTRLLNIEYSQSLPYSLTSNYLGEELPESKINNVSNVSVISTFNLLRKKRWALSTTLNYNFLSANVDANDLFTNTPLNDQRMDFHYHSTSLTMLYYSKLFNKTIIYSGTATLDGSEKHFERLRGLLVATMVLKATQNTKMTLGLIGLVDPNSIVPVFLSFSYERRYDNGWTIDAVLPKWLYIRKNIGEGGRLSVGSELGGTRLYLYKDSKVFTASQMNINSGLWYEHMFGKSIIASFKTGVRISPSSRLMDKNANFKDYIIDAKPDPSIYFNLGISYNPF